MANLKNITVNDTGFVQLPAGSATQRVGADAGSLRLNTTKGIVESADGTTYDEISNFRENISTTNLQLHLDSSNPASYSGTGTTWNDLSGNGRNGTLSGVTYVNNENGGFMRFDAQSDNISFSSWTLTGNKTLSFWIRTNRPLSATDNWQIGWLEDGGTGRQFGMMFGVGQTQDLGFWGRGAAYDFSIESPTTKWIDIDQWTMVTVSVDSSNNIKVYKNGIQIGLSRNSDGLTRAKLPITSDSTNATFKIESRGPWDSGFTYLDLDCVLVYSRTLTDAEIFDIFRLQRKRFNPRLSRLGRSEDDPAASAIAIKRLDPLAEDGIYYIKPPGNPNVMRIHCDMTTDGGGWMLIARTHPGGSATAWGWKAGAFGAVDDYSQPYHMGWGTEWHNFSNTFDYFIMGNRKNINTSEWGPFIYKAGSNYNTLFTVDGTFNPPNRSTIKYNLAVWNRTNYPTMQIRIGWADTGNNTVYFMRDASGYTSTSYGVTPARMGTTYCASTTVLGYSGPWCAGNSTEANGDFVQKYNNANYGGTNQCMIMVR